MAQCFWHNGMASASELEGLSSIPTSSSDRQNAMPPTFFFGEKEASCDKWFIDGQLERGTNIGNLFTDRPVFCFSLLNGLTFLTFSFGLTQGIYESSRTVFLTNLQTK